MLNNSVKVLNEDKVKRGLYLVLWVHIVMFFVVFATALKANSIAVYLDAMDFFGDAIGYSLSIYFLNKNNKIRSYVSVCKAIVIIICAIPILAFAVQHYIAGYMPHYELMTMTGSFGIIAHAICLYYLNDLRKGDSNLVSAWVLTINDLLCNLLIIFTSFTIYLTGHAFWDLLTAIIILMIAVFGALKILKRAFVELKNNM